MGQTIDIVSMRNAFLMGMQPMKATFEHDLIIRRLSYNGGTWMTDSPQEISQMIEPLDSLGGDILVGGLGLGVFTHLTGQEGWADEVTTIERSQDIIDLVSGHIDTDEIICADLFEFLKTTSIGRYDSGFFDVWQPTGELAWADYVVPLRRLARDCVGELLCWNEEEMRGQLMMNMPMHALLEKPSYDGYHRVFQKVAQSTGVVKTTYAVDDLQSFAGCGEAAIRNKDLVALLEQFLDPSSHEWEDIFGECWDENYPDQPKRC